MTRSRFPSRRRSEVVDSGRAVLRVGAAAFLNDGCLVNKGNGTSGHYEKASFMASAPMASALITSQAGSPQHSRTSHSHSPLRNSSSESEARKRRLAVLGSCIRASAFSFIARLACVY